MRKLRTLLLAASGLAAVIAIAPAGAGATAAIEVFDETSQTHCGEVVLNGHEVSGGCEISMTAEGGTSTPSVVIVGHNGVSEVVATSCSNRFDARFNEEGYGYVFNQVWAGTFCPLVTCDEASHAEVPGEAQFAELLPDRLVLSMTICLRLANSGEGGGPLIQCQMTLTVSEPEQHEYELTNNAPCVGNPGGELLGHWLIDETAIEVAHL